MQPLASIKVGKRHRTDLGDIEALADSIREVGLLHPVVVTPDRRLIAGSRRLAACKRLKWSAVPVHFVDLDRLVLGEFVENTVRKDFTLSEIADIARALRRVLEPRAHARRTAGLNRGAAPVGENFANGERGKTADIIGRCVGVSGRTLQKIEAVVAAAEAEPEKYGILRERMDETGKVSRAYRQLQVARLMGGPAPVSADGEVAVNSVVCGDCLEVLPRMAAGSADAVVFDPPWGVRFEHDENRSRNNDPEGYWRWFEPIFRETMRVLRPGGLWACWQSHLYMSQFWKWFGEDIRIFAACKDEVGLRAGRSYGWEPVVLTWKPGQRAYPPYGRRRPLDFFVSDWKAHRADELAGRTLARGRWTCWRPCWTPTRCREPS